MNVADKHKHVIVMDTIMVHLIKTKPAAESPNELPPDVFIGAGEGCRYTVVAWLVAGGHADATATHDEHEGFTMLMLAALGGHAEIVDTLLERNAAIDLTCDYCDYCKRSALELAAMKGHTDVALRLCLAGSKNVFLAINIAERFGHVDTVCELSMHIKRVHASLWNEAGEELPKEVASAAADGLEATVLAWVEGGGYVNATLSAEEGTKDKTLLHFACENNRASIVSLLIKHNADTNLQDSHGVSPLIESAARGHASIVSRL